jgi:hypothetical protein
MSIKTKTILLEECKNCPDFLGVKDDYVRCKRIKGVVSTVNIMPSNWVPSIENGTFIVHCHNV